MARQRLPERGIVATRQSSFFVITGGPGAGKTSIIAALRAREFRCVDEVGRAIIRHQIRIGSDAIHSGDRRKFLDLMLSHSLHDFEEATANTGPVFFDRGIPELVGYCRLSGFPVPDHLTNAARLFRYNARVFVTLPWPEIYRNDEERKQPFSEAVETCERVVEAYRDTGYELVEVPKTNIAARGDFIHKHVETWTGAPKT